MFCVWGVLDGKNMIRYRDISTKKCYFIIPLFFGEGMEICYFNWIRDVIAIIPIVIG